MKKIFSIILVFIIASFGFGVNLVLASENIPQKKILTTIDFKGEDNLETSVMYEERMAGTVLTAAKTILREGAKILKDPKNLKNMSDELIENSLKLAKEFEKTARNIGKNVYNGFEQIQDSIKGVIPNEETAKRLYFKILKFFDK